MYIHIYIRIYICIYIVYTHVRIMCVLAKIYKYVYMYIYVYTSLPAEASVRAVSWLESVCWSISMAGSQDPGGRANSWARQDVSEGGREGGVGGGGGREAWGGGRERVRERAKAGHLCIFQNFFGKSYNNLSCKNHTIKFHMYMYTYNYKHACIYIIMFVSIIANLECNKLQ